MSWRPRTDSAKSSQSSKSFSGTTGRRTTLGFFGVGLRGAAVGEGELFGFVVEEGRLH